MAPTKLSFLWNDLIKDATATAYSEVATLPVTNVQDSYVDKVYRSTGITDSEWMKFDLGSAMAVNCIALINHNLSVQSENLIIEANDTDSWAAPAYSSAATSGSAIASDAMSSDKTADWTDDGADITLSFDTDHYEVVTDGANKRCWLANKSVTANYLYEMRIKIKDGTAGGGYINFYFDDGAAQYSAVMTTTDTETEHVWHFRAASTTATAKLGIRVVDDLGGSANLELDDFSVIRITTSLSAWASGVTDCGTKTIVRMLFLDATKTYRWWRIRPQDFANAEGYIEIGRIMAGVYLESPQNINIGCVHIPVDPSEKSRYGSYAAVDRQYKYNQLKFTINYISETAKQDDFFTMLYSIGITEDIVICFDLSSDKNISNKTFYGQFENSPGFVNTQLNYYKTELIFNESVGDDT